MKTTTQAIKRGSFMQGW